ncbi:SGNH/GDSL hydrolase family protein [Mycobacterium paragordonae]|jgi:lysophospholipase L1-like esterase|uniref:SGNH/GDSL hydrolase family protein n=1 Tax=Mycobacterium paragordonae TaxID=1389713 RepID=A0AAJ1S078_9MYCO|nr:MULTISPECIES: SGNH/GDSL hydrolase family protein [Mycobacterium]AYE95873.1 SGNH/GDSL hydrolase family protein [Mycobacterium paragordonae]MDP7735056.1 SGNH/GDSL hydrolase family protein [Mycobacterium paragordonae]
MARFTRWRWGLTGGVAAVLAAGAVCAIPSSTGLEPAVRGVKRYVALGDSAAAAPLVPDAADPPGCFKSTNDYPAVLARRIGAANFVDVSCSGATAADIADREQSTSGGVVPRQIDAVTADTDLITITIGGNDVGLASSAAQCRRNSLAQPPCFADFVPRGTDRFSVSISRQIPLWEAMIGAVRAKAPRARIVLVGYATYIRPGGCFGEQPINPADADYFQAKVDEIDDQQRALATRLKVDFFDTRPVSVGHDMCAAPGERYIEGFELSHLAAPLHPNALGAGAVGSALAGELNLSDQTATSGRSS